MACVVATKPSHVAAPEMTPVRIVTPPMPRCPMRACQQHGHHHIRRDGDHGDWGVIGLHRFRCEACASIQASTSPHTISDCGDNDGQELMLAMVFCSLDCTGRAAAHFVSCRTISPESWPVLSLPSTPYLRPPYRPPHGEGR